MPVTPPDSPTRRDPTAARASAVIGGPIGRYAVRGVSFWTPLRVLVVFCAVTLLLAFAQKSPCEGGHWHAHSQYTQACYSDIVPLWGGEQLDVGAVPYRDHAVEYPVLTGGLMWVAAELTRGVGSVVGTSNLGVTFTLINCLLLALLGLVTLMGTVSAAGRRRSWDAAIFALSPLLVFHAFSNWDLLAMALTALALAAWARGRPVWSGLFIGLGMAAKLYPGLLVIPIAILAIRTRRYAEAAWCVAAAALAWLAVNLPVASAWFDGWKEFYTFSADRPAEASSVWQIGHYLNSTGIFRGNPTDWVPSGKAVAFVVLMSFALVVWLGLRAPVKPRLAQLALLIVAAFLLTTKVWSPQYSLWLVPLVALARPRWRITLLWQFSEIVVWIVTLLWLSTGGDAFAAASHGPTYGWVALACLIRDGFLVVICGLVVREMWNPSRDVVRADGLDDPGGGVFDGARDLFSWQARQARRAAAQPVPVVTVGSSGDGPEVVEADPNEPGRPDVATDANPLRADEPDAAEDDDRRDPGQQRP